MKKNKYLYMALGFVLVGVLAVGIISVFKPVKVQEFSSLEEANKNTVSNEVSNNDKREEDNIENNNTESNEEEETKEDTYSNIAKIDINDLEEKVNNKESFMLILTGTTCPHCLNYKPVLNTVLQQYKLKAMEIDVWTLNNNEREVLAKIIPNLTNVPTTTFIVKGKENEEQRTIGNLAKEDITDLLTTNGYIKK